MQNKLNNSLPQHIITEFKCQLSEEIKFFLIWFKKLTDLVIPDEIQQFLSLGPKFSVCPSMKDIIIDLFLGDIENIIDEFYDRKKNLYRAQFANFMTNYSHLHNNHIDQFTLIFNKCKKY